MSAALKKSELEQWLHGFIRDPAFLEAYPYYAAILAKMTPVADPSRSCARTAIRRARSRPTVRGMGQP